MADELISEKRQDVLLDLSELTMIDSSGVAQIIYLTKGIRGNGGEVRLSGIRNQPRYFPCIALRPAVSWPGRLSAVVHK